MIQDRDLTLAAGETLTVYVRAKLIVIKTATAEFHLRINGLSERAMNSGSKFGSENSRAYFRALTFRNSSAASNTIEYIVADEAVDIAQTVVTNVNTTGAAISNSLASCILATATVLLKTSTAAAAPVALTAAETLFRKAIVYGCKALAGTVNAGDVNIGPSATANQQTITIAPGGEYVIEPPLGCKDNLANWYLDVGTNADGVVVIYW